MTYAWALFREGKLDAALREARRGLALDPLAPGVRRSLVALAIGARRYDVALREVRPALPGGGVDPVSAVLQGYAQLLSGKAAECAAHDPGPWVAVRAMCPINWDQTWRPRPWPIRLEASSMRSATRSCTSMLTSRPTTPGAAMPPNP